MKKYQRILLLFSTSFIILFIMLKIHYITLTYHKSLDIPFPTIFVTMFFFFFLLHLSTRLYQYLKLVLKTNSIVSLQALFHSRVILNNTTLYSSVHLNEICCYDGGSQLSFQKFKHISQRLYKSLLNLLWRPEHFLCLCNFRMNDLVIFIYFYVTVKQLCPGFEYI